MTKVLLLLLFFLILMAYLTFLKIILFLIMLTQISVEITNFQEQQVLQNKSQEHHFSI